MIATAMLSEGTSGSTHQELIEKFKFDPQNIISKNQLQQMLGKTALKDSYLNYIISNSIWINKEIKGNIKEEYKDVLDDKYDSVIKKITNKEANVLNEWVQKKTK